VPENKTICQDISVYSYGFGFVQYF